MIFALTNAVQDQLKRDIKAAAKARAGAKTGAKTGSTGAEARAKVRARKARMMHAPELMEEELASIHELVQRSTQAHQSQSAADPKVTTTDTEPPVTRLEEWLETDAGRREPRYQIKVINRRGVVLPELPDIWFVHIRKVERRNTLFFGNWLTGVLVVFTLGSFKFYDGRNTLIDIFYLGLRRLGYSAETVRAYVAGSPIRQWTTTGTASDRVQMNQILDTYWPKAPELAAGERLMETTNLVHHYRTSYNFHRGIYTPESKMSVFARHLEVVTGVAPVVEIPAMDVRVRLLSSDEAQIAEWGDNYARFAPSTPPTIPVVLTPSSFPTTPATLTILPPNAHPTIPMPPAPHEQPWRSFRIPQATSFQALSEAIMACFGLLNYHWSEFNMRSAPRNTDRQTVVLEQTDYDENAAERRYTLIEKGVPEEKLPIHHNQVELPAGKLLDHADETIYWAYDYGDGFWYEITDVSPSTLSTYDVEFLDGAGDAPPTDVGGYSGLEEFQEALTDVTIRKHAALVNWAVSLVGWLPFEPQYVRDRITWADPLELNRIYSNMDELLEYAKEINILKLMGIPDDIFDGEDEDDDDY